MQKVIDDIGQADEDVENEKCKAVQQLEEEGISIKGKIGATVLALVGALEQIVDNTAKQLTENGDLLTKQMSDLSDDIKKSQ